jgi:hypothetical protein
MYERKLYKYYAVACLFKKLILEILYNCVVVKQRVFFFANAHPGGKFGRLSDDVCRSTASNFASQNLNL